MGGGISFILSSVLFGLGLAVDAFLISLSNGINAPQIKRGKIFAAAAVFAVFQFAAPMLGWICVKTVASKFALFKDCLSGIALAILLFLGIKMLVAGLRTDSAEPRPVKTGIGALLLQAMVTSVDALSVGFAITQYNLYTALMCSAIIAAVTFIVYTAGFFTGRKFGGKFADKADLIGGIIFIVMALEVFFRGF